MFYFLGLAVTAYAFLQSAFLVFGLLRPSLIARFRRRDRDAWALVTGASDGIGFGFCQELAANGFHLVLHGRNQKKLDNVAVKLATDFPGLKTRVFLADASEPVSFDGLEALLQGIDLTVLVNNVGGTASLPRPFMPLHEHSLHDIDSVISLNAGFTTKLTRNLLPLLISNGPSLVLNISSLSTMGVPCLSVYAGTKGYLEAHSESLQTELVAKNQDVTIHAVRVGSVQSAGNKSNTGFLVPSSRAMARATLGKVGSSSVAITPYFPHALLKFFIEILPPRMRQQALIRAMEDTRAAIDKTE